MMTWAGVSSGKPWTPNGVDWPCEAMPAILPVRPGFSGTGSVRVDKPVSR